MKDEVFERQAEYLKGALERQSKLLDKLRGQRGILAGGAYAPVTRGNPQGNVGAGDSDVNPSGGSVALERAEPGEGALKPAVATDPQFINDQPGG